MSHNKSGLLSLCLLAVAAIACKNSTGQVTQSPTLAIPTTQATGLSEVLSTPLPATSTPSLLHASPTATNEACTYDTAFVSDVTIPDDAPVSAGSSFRKTWRIRNSGSCAWEAGTRWVFSDGDQMGGPSSVLVPGVAPGETADISVTLTAPSVSGTYLGNWRMNRPDGEAIGVTVYVRIKVVPSSGLPTPTQVALATSTPSAGDGSGPTILFFRANVTRANPGDTISLEWDTTGADSITIYHLLGSGQLGMPFWDVEPRGSLDYAIDASERNATRFVLFAGNGSETAQATVSVVLNCLDVWFFTPAPDICPAAPPLHSPAAQQAFERGVMIWVQAQDQVIALFADGQSPHWRAYADNWNSGDPSTDPGIQPPAGFFQPERGFGLVWRDEPGVRDRLGWALAPESGFSTIVQSTSRYKYNDTYIKFIDGSVWVLLTEGSGWQQVSP